jgi:putative DNA primase/helicase
MNSILISALSYSQIGWYIFPVKFKIPITEHGFLDASNDADQINEWFNQYPDAGIAVATGKKSGIVVLDFDVHKHTEAQEYLEELLKDKNFTVSPVQARSGGGGLHLFYRLPDNKDISCSVGWNNHLGFDIRGSGGYLLLPPSPHESGNVYEWLVNPGQAEMPDLPEMFYIKEKKRTGRKIVISADVKEGSRHLEMARRAGMLRAAGLEPDQIYQNLLVINQRFCKPPLENDELTLISRSMSQYPAYNTKNNGEQIVKKEEKRNIQEENGQLIQFELNDTGHAEALVYLHGKKIRYNCVQGKWLIWNGQIWEQDSTGYINWFVVDTYRRIKEAANQIEDPERRDKVLKNASSLGNYTKIISTLKMAQSLDSIATASKEWDANPMLFGVANGVIDLTTGILSDGKPEQLISRCSLTHYNKEAQCLLWLKFLSEIFDGNQEIVDFIQRIVGYSLTGYVSEQYLYMFCGHGSNGKSTFLKTILKLMGDYGIKTPFSTFERRVGGSSTNDIAALEGKRFVMASESNNGVTVDEARLKALTGGDPISARYLYQEHFTFEPTGKILIAVNHRPIVKDDSYGFWRRVLLVDFPIVFDEKTADNMLDMKLVEELPGILNWAIEGCLAWQKSGLMIPGSVKIATDQYKADSNPLQDMLTSYCVIQVDDSSLAVNGNDLYKVYLYYAEKHNLKPNDKMSRTSFLKKFDDNYTHSSGQAGKMYYGISLNEEGLKILNENHTYSSSVVTVNRIK